MRAGEASEAEMGSGFGFWTYLASDISEDVLNALVGTSLRHGLHVFVCGREYHGDWRVWRRRVVGRGGADAMLATREANRRSTDLGTPSSRGDRENEGGIGKGRGEGGCLGVKGV